MPPEQSSDSVKIISLDRNSLLARLRATAARIRAEHPEVTEVRLFGSVARGDQTGTSDVDILILLAGTADPDSLDRILAFLPYFDLDRGADLLVLTEEELQARLHDGNAFVKQAFAESLLL